VVRHRLDKSGCKKETWENDAAVKTEKGKQKNSRQDASFQAV